MFAKWNEQSEQLKSTGIHVCVLSLEKIHNNSDRGPDLEFVGMYNSKAPALAKLVTVATIYGRFDNAIKDIISYYDGDHEYNIENPPDNGVLVKLGHKDSGEDGFSSLFICKCPVVGI